VNSFLVEAKKQYNDAIWAFNKVFKLDALKNFNVIKLNANSITECTYCTLSNTTTSQSVKVFRETVQRILQTVDTQQFEKVWYRWEWEPEREIGRKQRRRSRKVKIISRVYPNNNRTTKA